MVRGVKKLTPQCPRCGTTNLAAFGYSCQRHDGYSSYCKKCGNLNAQESYRRTHAPVLRVAPINTTIALHPAYVAGILDGEGCIGIQRRGLRAIQPYVKVTMTNRTPLDLLFARYGGCEIGEYQNSQPERWSQAYEWEVTRGAVVGALLVETWPYLIIKRSQAAVALAMLEHRPEWYAHNVSEERLALHEKLLGLGRALNERGPHAPVTVPQEVYDTAEAFIARTCPLSSVERGE